VLGRDRSSVSSAERDSSEKTSQGNALRADDTADDILMADDTTDDIADDNTKNIVSNRTAE
jgi:hypothetical protein